MITLNEIGKKRQAKKADEARWPWWKKICSAMTKAFTRTVEWPNKQARRNDLLYTVNECSDLQESLKVLQERHLSHAQLRAIFLARFSCSKIVELLQEEFGPEIEDLYGDK